MKKKKWIIAVIIVLFLIILLLLLSRCGKWMNAKPEAGKNGSGADIEDIDVNNGDFEGSYLKKSYKGKEYTYNSRILTVMYAGIDSDRGLITYNRYSIAPRADTIELVIFDDYNKKISILAISRDTVTSIARYTMNGNYRDNYDTNIGYAYTYGDGGKVSCNNLIESVRTLLKGVPVHEYVVTDISSIVELNNKLGGVTVTVPNDDLAKMHPELVTGAKIKLDDSNVDDFVRWRDTRIPFSNNSRIERQRLFSSEVLRKFEAMVSSDREGTWAWIEEMSQKYQTSITRNQYLELADRFNTEKFDDSQYYILKGKNIYDEKNDIDKFFADEESLMDTIIELFYLEEK